MDTKGGGRHNHTTAILLTPVKFHIHHKTWPAQSHPTRALPTKKPRHLRTIMATIATIAGHLPVDHLPVDHLPAHQDLRGVWNRRARFRDTIALWEVDVEVA